MNVKAHPPMHRHLFLGGSCPLPAQPKGGGGTPPILPPQALEDSSNRNRNDFNDSHDPNQNYYLQYKVQLLQTLAIQQTSGHYSILTNDCMPPKLPPGGSGPLINGSLCPPESTPQTASWLVQLFSRISWIFPTDRPRNNRTRLCRCDAA